MVGGVCISAFMPAEYQEQGRYDYVEAVLIYKLFKGYKRNSNIVILTFIGVFNISANDVVFPSCQAFQPYFLLNAG